MFLVYRLGLISIHCGLQLCSEPYEELLSKLVLKKCSPRILYTVLQYRVGGLQAGGTQNMGEGLILGCS
jgi:hypothetical protein